MVLHAPLLHAGHGARGPGENGDPTRLRLHEPDSDSECQIGIHARGNDTSIIQYRQVIFMPIVVIDTVGIF